MYRTPRLRLRQRPLRGEVLEFLCMKKGIDYIGVAVAFICHDGQGNFLMHKRSENCRDEHHKWDNGGGGVKFGEHPEEALWRELQEEYGCAGVIDEALPVRSRIRQHGDVATHWVTFPYIVRVNRDEVKMNEPDMMTEIGWFRLDDLPQPLHSIVEKQFQEWKDIFASYAK